MSDLPNMPLDNKERYLAAIAGQNVDLPEPADRKDMYLKYIAENGGGGGGTVDAYTKAESDAKYATKSEVNNINWMGSQAQYEALTPEQKTYELYNITEAADETVAANTASLQSLSPLSLDRDALTFDDYDTMDYPKKEVSDYADFDE